MYMIAFRGKPRRRVSFVPMLLRLSPCWNLADDPHRADNPRRPQRRIRPVGHVAAEFLADPIHLEEALKAAPKLWEAKNLQVVLETIVVNTEAGVRASACRDTRRPNGRRDSKHASRPGRVLSILLSDHQAL